MGLIPRLDPEKSKKSAFFHTKNDHEIEKYQKFEFNISKKCV